MHNEMPILFKEERGHTDQSLNQERERTDESLSDVRKANELKTDATLKTNRQAADAARTQTRSDIDSDLKDLRDHKAGRSSEGKKMEHLTDALLREQRSQNEDAVTNERFEMDAAIREERAQTQAALLQMLSKERKSTDANLHSERERTDLETRLSVQRLNTEQASHVATKAELTTRDEFLAIVSHDLRNPIGAVLSYMDLLAEDESLSGISDEARYWIEVVKRNAATSLRMISDILDMERIADGKLDLEFRKQRLDLLVDEVLETFLRAAATKKIKLQAVPVPLGLAIVFDHDRILQVLSNLVGNAIKFTPVGGVISVEAFDRHDQVEIAVSDSGPGIPETDRKKIFERYAQLKNKDRQGLGLGLYISMMLIQQHGGRMWVEPAPDHGSSFRFTLPVLRNI